MSRRLIAAMSGWGKSYHAQAIMENSIPAFDYAAVLDFKDEYRGLVEGGIASHLIVGPNEQRWTRETWREFFEQNGAVVLARHRLSPEQWREVSARVVGALRELARENGSALIAVDEAHFVAPQRGTVPDEIEGLATTGRGEGASSLWITQRLAKLEETIVSQADETLAGAFSSRNDRQKLDPEYPEAVHNPQADSIRGLPEELHADEGAIPLRKFEENGSTIGSEWVFADNKGNLERRNTRGMQMETTHYGAEGNPLKDPEYS